MASNRADKLRQWIAQAERSLGRLIEVEGLHLDLLQVKQGPTTISFVTRLRRPSKTALQKLLSLDKAIGQALRSSSVRVSDTPEGILIQIPSPLPWTPPGELLARKSTGLKLAVGIDENRQIAYVDMANSDTSHLLLIGPSGRGKSQALRTLLYSLAKANTPRTVLFLIMAKKVSDWRAFEPSSSCLGLVTKPEDQERALEWLLDVQESRSETGQNRPHIFLIVDDLKNVVARANIAGGLGEIASMGRGVGIHLILSTQRDGKAGGLTDGIPDNIPTRLLYGAAEAAAGARAAGQGGLGVEKVGVSPGDCLLLLQTEARRIATGMISSTEIATLSVGTVGDCPWKAPEQAKQAGTGKNKEEQAKQARTGPETLPHDSHAVSRVEAGSVYGQEQPQEQGSQNSLQNIFDPRMSREEIREKSLRFDTSRPPTPKEQEQIQELYQILGSIARATLGAYGHYNGTVQGYVSATLKKGDKSQQDRKTARQEYQIPKEIDISTEAGRKALESLQEKGLLKLPDVLYLLEEKAPDRVM